MLSEKKRFRILVDKQAQQINNNETTPLVDNNQKLNEDTIVNTKMDSSKELKIKQKHNNKHKNKHQLESIEQQANLELEKSKRSLDSQLQQQQIRGGTSIDRLSNDEDDYLHSDDEGMVEEIVTTVEEDKDLECKVKKKIETKKTVAEDPENT